MTSATSDLSRQLGAAIAQQQLELPAMPATAAQVMSLCQIETTDAARLSAVAHRDPAIAAQVLRVANSAALGGHVPCTSLQQACSRLGMRSVGEIAMAVALRGRLFHGPRAGALLAPLWRHSVLTAFFAKEIARVRRRSVDIAFLGGLLHDVGKAVLLAHVDRAEAQGRAPVDEGELVAGLHEHHVAAGGAVAAAWQLPEQIAEAMLCHHEPSAATRFQDLAATVAFADALAHHAAPSVLAEAPSAAALRGHALLLSLNLYPDQVEQLLALQERALAVAEELR
ncbi:MAG: HDOD domain-containing protein [Planctomycetes bacterium]|nr:HDOD domain-containing protein [Planctomycetota bacterium]